MLQPQYGARNPLYKPQQPLHKQLLQLLQERVPEDEVIRIRSIAKYKPIQTLGMGRFGDVIKYMDKECMTFITGKRVKLEMFDHYYQDIKRITQRLETFISEFRELHRISLASNRIANFVGFYADNTQMLIFSEYLPNGSVKDRLMKESLSEETAVRYFCQAVEALHYLHTMPTPIVHRDIKASNLLITISDSVKLANFGLVRDLAVDGFGIAVASEISLDFRGTLLYVAPEIMKSELGPGNRNAYGLPADIWALGCTFVEMLVRTPPHFEYFGQVDEIQTELRTRADGPEENQLPYRAEVLVPTSSRKVQYIVDRIFENDPEIRPTTKQLVELLPSLGTNASFSDNYNDDFEPDMHFSQPSTSKEPPKITKSTPECEVPKEEPKKEPNGIGMGYEPMETLEDAAFRRKRTIHKRKRRRRGKFEKTAICTAYHCSRVAYFSCILSRAICYVLSFLAVGLGALAFFLFVAFSIVWMARQMISQFCECDLMQPQYLIISGILLILLFALLFSCCMVALGEYKFRKANRTLRESRFWVPRPSDDIRICGLPVVRAQREETDSEESDLESTLPDIREKIPDQDDQNFYYV